MASWKRDFASGLVVIGPLAVTAYVIAWLYGAVASVTPESIVSPELLKRAGIPVGYAELIRVVVTVAVFVVLVFAIGYLMRTTAGGLFEAAIDDVINRVPGLRVVYNASKMAAETALEGPESLRTPVKMETWEGVRMTAFKTGKTTPDGREVVFLPTAPNITTGFVIEVDPDDIEETDESVEDALTRILSAGFGESGTRSHEVGLEDILGDSTASDVTEGVESEDPPGDVADPATPPGDTDADAGRE